MINQKTKIIPLTLGVLIFSLVVAYLVLAWTEPPQTPPQGNVPAPLNVGNETQTKTGELRFPIFRDSDDTRYYLNPAGISVLAGNVGIGTTTPQRQFQIDSDVDGIGFDGTTTSPNAGVFRFGDNTGWRLHFGRSREKVGGAINTGTTGVLMTIQDNGNVGIGTTGPSYKLHVNGTVGATAYYYVSDTALKENIVALENSLEKILQLQGVSFNWRDSKEKSIGLIAQEVERIFPEAVYGETGQKSVDYGKLIAPLIEAIKEQQKEIEKLKAEVELLKAR